MLARGQSGTIIGYVLSTVPPVIFGEVNNSNTGLQGNKYQFFGPQIFVDIIARNSLCGSMLTRVALARLSHHT